jgi:hypothetical protein
MEPERDLKAIPDDELLHRLGELLRQSRRVEADLVAHIGEVDLRRLYAREAAPSMFAYCTERLHLSEAEAYLRIAAARASREHPMLLEMLRDGRLHLSAIAKLAPHLTRDNREALLERAVHRSKRQIEELVAELVPRPDAPAVMRRLPAGRVHHEPTPTLELRPDAVAPSMAWTHPNGVASTAHRPAPGAAGEPAFELRPDAVEGRASIEPLAPARYKVQFTASAELHDNTARDRLEFHHRHPFGHGGDRGLENIQLLCRSHNQYVAEHDYGKQAMARHRRSEDRVSEASAVYASGSLSGGGAGGGRLQCRFRASTPVQPRTDRQSHEPRVAPLASLADAVP